MWAAIAGHGSTQFGGIIGNEIETVATSKIGLDRPGGIPNRNGLIVDATGADPYAANVAVDGSVIVAIGKVTSSGK